MAREHGFTLLEALVAVALLAVLGLAAALTLNSSIRSERIVGSSIDELQRLQRSFQWLRRDLEQVVTRRGRTEQGDYREQSLGASESGQGVEEGVVLDFYKTGRRILTRVPPSAHLERVRYRLEQGRLIRDSSPFPDAPAGERWYSAILMETLLGMEVRYFSEQTWHDQWPPTTAGPDAGPLALPQALQITLETERYGRVEQTVLLHESL
nr:type II secretion system minor pseudopilin GspJ [Motiliproteus sp. SC1-56]